MHQSSKLRHMLLHIEKHGQSAMSFFEKPCNRLARYKSGGSACGLCLLLPFFQVLIPAVDPLRWSTRARFALRVQANLVAESGREFSIDLRLWSPAVEIRYDGREPITLYK